MIAAVGLAAPLEWAAAQTCTADVQCQSGFRTSARCVGDTLVQTESRCLGGYCREQEIRRERCASGIGSGRCAGGTHIRTESRCDPTLQRCVARQDSDVCLKSCVVRGKRLIVSTGQCFPATGCVRSVVECPNGGECTPEPRCLPEKS